MSFSSKALFLMGAGLACVPVLMADQPFLRQRPRVQLNVPMTDPFSLEEAVDLPEWGQILRMTTLLQTDAGTLTLLHEMPQVEARYADESYFLDFIRKWRERIPALPERPFSKDESASSWVVLDNGTSRTIAITFPQEFPEDSFIILKITWVDQEITNLSFMSGFNNVLPRRRWHRFGRG